MTEEKYQKLNGYLNEVFIELEKLDQFLINNLLNIGEISEKYMKFIKQKDLSFVDKKNNLTFNDVYLLGREIVENIDKNYLKDYDTLIKTGELDFSYDNEYSDSSCLFLVQKDMTLININRNFNYEDVITLIHEYMHRTNIVKKFSVNRYLLTEFISIYFELYAEKYMIEVKQIPKDEVINNHRLLSTRRHASSFNWYYLELVLYRDNGVLNENSYKVFNMKKEEYEEECLKMLEKFEKNEEDYKFKIMYEKEYDHDYFRQILSSNFSYNYRYILGFLLAVYASEHSDIDKILYLNKNINNEKYANLNIVEILKTIDIDLNDSNFFEDLFNSLDEYIKKYQREKNR